MKQNITRRITTDRPYLTAMQSAYAIYKPISLYYRDASRYAMQST